MARHRVYLADQYLNGNYTPIRRVYVFIVTPGESVPNSTTAGLSLLHSVTNQLLATGTKVPAEGQLWLLPDGADARFIASWKPQNVHAIVHTYRDEKTPDTAVITYSGTRSNQRYEIFFVWKRVK